MKTIDEWFEEYGVSHRNQTNKFIHWICVPLIFWSIVALLASIPSSNLKEIFPMSIQPYIHWGTVMIILGFLFYLRLSFSMSIGILLFSFFCLQIIVWINESGTSLWLTALIIFAAAWVGQFIGHEIEGKKPSFFKDLQFLMIGPAWLLGFIYRKLGIRY